MVLSNVQMQPNYGLTPPNNGFAYLYYFVYAFGGLFFFLFLSFIHILNVGGSLVEITYGHTHSQYNLTLIINHFGQVIVQTSLDKERMKSAVMTCANRVE